MDFNFKETWSRNRTFLCIDPIGRLELWEANKTLPEEEQAFDVTHEKGVDDIGYTGCTLYFGLPSTHKRTIIRQIKIESWVGINAECTHYGHVEKDGTAHGLELANPA